ncbi:MAG: GDP-mannose 4,6-dehydratase [Beijerinckiaceae bacterium]|nr:GDP-mannose 4,6-dehydratase [Beijerinckiaceae bacterium]
MKKKVALIVGVTGQDGAYLAHFLLNRGYFVVGSSRDAEKAHRSRLEQLGILNKMQLVTMVPNDFHSVYATIAKIEPDEIYNLSGQSSVGLSFVEPVQTLESIAVATLNLLETVRLIKPKIRFFTAGSSECFGETVSCPATEETAFSPRSPYGVAKASAFWNVANYRDAYGLYACSGILFNHESPLRSERFVTRKIISAVCRIANGSKEQLRLGNTQIVRDWGWAPEYVEVMWLMLQRENADDFVIATGSGHSLQAFIIKAFNEVGLDWSQYIVVDQNLIRPTDISVSFGDASKARRLLGWSPKVHFDEIVSRLVAAEAGSK